MTGDSLSSEWQFALRIFSMSRLQVIAALREALGSNPLLGWDPVEEGGAGAEKVSDARCDVLLVVEEGTLCVLANESGLPLVYLDESRGRELDEKERMQHLEQARWLIRSVNQRSRAIVRVAQCIVDRCSAFFEGDAAECEPLECAEVARAAEMQPSTVRRLTEARYISTPRGVFELASFLAK